MSYTGMERCIDKLGRVVIPMEIRKSLNLPTDTPLAISVEGNKIIFEKSIRACILCGTLDDVKDINGKRICKKCLAEMAAAASAE